MHVGMVLAVAAALGGTAFFGWALLGVPGGESEPERRVGTVAREVQPAAGAGSATPEDDGEEADGGGVQRDPAAHMGLPINASGAVLPDGQLTARYTTHRTRLEPFCEGLPEADGVAGTVDALLLGEEALAEVGVTVGTTAYLLRDDIARVARFGVGVQDQRLLLDLGVAGGAERRATVRGGRIELAYLDFTSPAAACVFAQFDFAFPPGEIAELMDDVPTGWVGRDHRSRFVHFQVADRVYLFLADLGVDEELLRDLARRQYAAGETI